MFQNKKLFSIILTLCMIFTTLGTAFAAETEKKVNKVQEVKAAVAAAKNACDKLGYCTLEEFTVYNDMTSDEFLALVKKLIIPEGNETIPQLYTDDDYHIKNATAEKEGSIKCNVMYTCEDYSQRDLILAKIPKLTGSDAYKSEDRVNIEADQAAIKEYMKKVSTTNDTTAEKLLDGIKTAVSHGSTVSWADDFNKKEATEKQSGYIKGTVNLSLNGEKETVTINQAILKIVPGYPQEEKIPIAENKNTFQDAGFTDVGADEYYAKPVNWAVGKRIAAGTTATTFSPNETCTRAQILTFLWRASGSPKSSAKNKFSDVSQSDYYYNAAVWASEKGMVTGSKFEADTPCTRSATVMYLWQNAGSPEIQPEQMFSDVPVGSDYASAVCWAVKNQITSGTSETNFSPDIICSRGQIVTFLFRAAK